VHNTRGKKPVLLYIAFYSPLYLIPRVVPWFDFYSSTILALQIMYLAVIQQVQLILL